MLLSFSLFLPRASLTAPSAFQFSPLAYTPNTGRSMGMAEIRTFHSLATVAQYEIEHEIVMAMKTVNVINADLCNLASLANSRFESMDRFGAYSIIPYFSRRTAYDTVIMMIRGAGVVFLSTTNAPNVKMSLFDGGLHKLNSSADENT